MARLMIVEDDADIAMALTVVLRRGGHEVSRAPDGPTALRIASSVRPHLVVLDVALRGLGAWQVLERIRDLSDVPVLMLTGPGRDAHRVRGPHGAADGYLTKPFASAELSARVEALLRRSGEAAWAGPDLVYGQVVLSPSRHAVTVDGDEVSTSPLEFRLLNAFLRHPGQVLTPERLLTTVWEDESGTGRGRVKFAVLRLRRKLGWDTVPSPLRAVRGVGYRLEPLADKAGQRRR